MSFKPTSEQSTINIAGQDYPCAYHHKSQYSWYAVCNVQGKTHEAKGATRAEAERNLSYKANE